MPTITVEMTETDIGSDAQFPVQANSLQSLENRLLSIETDTGSSNGHSSEPVSPNEWESFLPGDDLKLPESVKLTKRKPRQTHKCLECGKTFKQLPSFRKHLLQHVKQPLVATQRCDRSKLYDEALRRSSKLTARLMPAAAGSGLKLKIKLDGSKAGNNFEVVQYEETESQVGDELSNSSSTASNSIADNTREQTTEDHTNDELSGDGQAETSVTNTESAQVNNSTHALNESAEREENSLSNNTQTDDVEESLARILSKSIQDDENSATPSIDPFHGILEEQEEQERAIAAGGLRVLTLTPQTPASQSSAPSSPSSIHIKSASPAYFPSQTPTLPCRLGDNVMVELNTAMLTPRSMDSPAEGTSTPPVSSADHGKLLHQILNGVDSVNTSTSNTTQSEYMSLDKLQLQHTCATCNLGFPDMTTLEEHCRTQGHISAPASISGSNNENTPPAYTQLQTPAQQQQQQALFQPQYTSLQPPQYGSTMSSQYNGPVTSQQQFGMASHQIPYGQPPVPMEQLAQQVRNMPLPPHQQPHNNMGIRYMTQPHMITPQQSQQPGQLPQSSQIGQPPYGISNMQPGVPTSQHQQQPAPYSRMAVPYRMQRPPGAAGSYSQQQYYPQQQRAPYQRYSSRMANGFERGRNPGGMTGGRPSAIGSGVGRPMKRPNTQIPAVRQTASATTTGGPKLRKMSDLLLPGNNESDDCSLISVQNADPTLPVIQNVHGNAQTSSPIIPKEAIRLSDQITLSVRNKEPATSTNNQMPRSKEAKAVANILAQRGITVTTGATNRKNGSSSDSQESRQEVSLNLNNAVSLIPTNKSGNKSIVATVDLTDDKPKQREVFAAGSKLLNCHLCNKQFLKQAALNLHVVKNHPSVKLPYRCGECTAKYPTLDGLTTHQRVYHVPSAELGLPVVDLSRSSTLNALANLGISNYVPLSSLDQQAGAHYGIPIVSVQVAQNSASSKLHALGASDILSIGPLKQLPRYQQN